ncbi:MAG TPA: glycosyltransferase [Bacteroidia bacterium]|nr:glycosyltransferase [Bacteroidia bacterium]HMU19815.1 glycosyltransferase [Bacteroidia bacterium]
MAAKKKILVFIDWYLPGYKAGGPIKSCASIISNLKDDFDFAVITSDTDFSDTQPYPNIKPDQWNISPDGTRVYYFSQHNFSQKSLREVMQSEQPDILYMNSFFSQNFTLKPLKIARKYLPKCKCIIAPRGMLGAGALAIKPLKKLVFISLSKMLATFDKVRWHASTEQEAKEIKAMFGNRAEVRVALNLSSVKPAVSEKKIKYSGQLNLVFFSRVSKKKNLHLVLEWLKAIPQNLKVTFQIYGTLEDDAYWSQCKDLIKLLPQNISVEYKGVIDARQSESVFENNHFSILPTMHENYGHAIIESLAFGVPVIISNNTPWHGLEAKYAGFDFPLDNQQHFIESLLNAASMDQKTYSLWQNGAIELAKEVLNNSDTVNQNRKLFAE